MRIIALSGTWLLAVSRMLAERSFAQIQLHRERRATVIVHGARDLLVRALRVAVTAVDLRLTAATSLRIDVATAQCCVKEMLAECYRLDNGSPLVVSISRRSYASLEMFIESWLSKSVRRILRD